MIISVIVCTHNPSKDYFRQVLGALRKQTLPTTDWELLVVDNASHSSIEEDWDLSWHPQARHVREESLGLTNARVCGINESRGELIVFVDDDNVLEADYLETTRAIAHTFPVLGAWGGEIQGRFEEDPEPWTRVWWPYLGIRPCEKPRWSNKLDDGDALPCGAGLCVRRNVALEYVRRIHSHPGRLFLGRKGSSLASCEDTDLVWNTSYLGLGIGRFPSLKLFHLIPKRRLNEKYLTQLIRSMTSSLALLDYLYQREIPAKPDPVRVAVRTCLTFLLKGKREARFYLARRRGTSDGLALIASVKGSSKL